ncbi:single-stranded-DNA-specific exonuclease RecJ [Spirulina subsalsa FACHB-351]|uniref:Single-stranded-DNA-specific exonuclease RecJ n=2 Tax=Spirulina subsalsa TaxID=54311 RepID=A0ABT3L5H1_9CYAN|nr:single-stranded-DNA-specific exonuclease RecJ [Spirulina subsalsa FACHB-351]
MAPTLDKPQILPANKQKANDRNRLMTPKLPQQRWIIAPAQPEAVAEVVQNTGLSPVLAQVLLNRGITTPHAAQVYMEPESESLPPPLEEFPDLQKSVDLLINAIEEGEKIAICGDYDADGMTSTALLIRALRHLGADVDYAIPSRMKDGYGINKRIVKEFAEQGVGLILTVDNGIAAYDAIALAVELGLSVIITDHHDLPPKLPPADAILNPKLIPEDSPYCGLAGVGVAYILAVTLAQQLGHPKGLIDPLLELFTLGTIADLAPLVGVNRRWLKRGLKRLPKSNLEGIKALMQVAGVGNENKPMPPDAIGFRLGPRINAVGRIGDPQIVIELLTTDDPGIALERAMYCEQRNQERQDMCTQIELEALEKIENEPILWQNDRVLVIFQPHWHHGVIGIVASRLVERYGVPVFICTSEDDGSIIRGSARGIPEFHVSQALNYCDDVLEKHGGHKAAGGFSLKAEALAAFKTRLSEFAHQCLDPHHLKPLVEIDVEVSFSQLQSFLYQQIEGLQPWGIGNETPIFLSPNVRIMEQQVVKGNHLKATFQQETPQGSKDFKGIAWRWGEYCPLPTWVDIAYKLKENTFNGATNLELEVVGVRPADPQLMPLKNEVKTAIHEPPKTRQSPILAEQNGAVKKAAFNYNNRRYTCSLWESLNELRIRNDQGKVLAVVRGQRRGLLGENRDSAREVDVTQAPFYDLIKAALVALKQG